MVIVHLKHSNRSSRRVLSLWVVSLNLTLKVRSRCISEIGAISRAGLNIQSSTWLRINDHGLYTINSFLHFSHILADRHLRLRAPSFSFVVATGSFVAGVAVIARVLTVALQSVAKVSIAATVFFAQKT